MFSLPIYLLHTVECLVNQVSIFHLIPIVQKVKMVQTPTSPETETLLIELPSTIGLYVTQEQFAALAAANRDLRLERTAVYRQWRSVGLVDRSTAATSGNL
jgi:hypothetical protein